MPRDEYFRIGRAERPLVQHEAHQLRLAKNRHERAAIAILVGAQDDIASVEDYQGLFSFRCTRPQSVSRLAPVRRGGLANGRREKANPPWVIQHDAPLAVRLAPQYVGGFAAHDDRLPGWIRTP